jgi:hypothetical protein
MKFDHDRARIQKVVVEVIVGLRHRQMVELAKAEAAKHSHLYTSSWPTTMVRDPEGVSCVHAPAP